MKQIQRKARLPSRPHVLFFLQLYPSHLIPSPSRQYAYIDFYLFSSPTQSITMSANKLHAAYVAPDQSRTFEHSISSPLPSADAVPQKVTYLAELRKLVPTLQNDINVFLTERMEEDKKAAEAQGRKVSDKEAKEEENYGEEVVEEDA